MASHQPYEAETLLPPGALNNYSTPRSSVVDSLGVPGNNSQYDGVRESQYSSVPLNQSFDPYAGAPSPRGTTPAPYQDDPSAEKIVEHGYGETKTKRPWFWTIVILVLLAIIAVAVIVPVYFKVIKPNTNIAESSSSTGASSTSAAQPTQSSKPNTPEAVVTGGDGSKITTESGATFTYNNSFGGIWYYDPKDPFSNKAHAQSWSPPLNQSWKFGTDQIRGVNLGGWLVLEPFISPAMYEPYMNATVPAIDEWTLCENLAQDASSGGVAKAIEEHYKTFITEEDFAQIAAAGLNWIRIPIPYWAIEVYPGEPFLEGVAWKYFLKAIEWARKYGLRINLDLHTVPGSQNGYNHSGMLGPVGWCHYFFWTWKVGESTTWGNIVAAPLWSYKHGLENGYMPTDPREAVGACGGGTPRTGPLPASKTGGVGAGTIPASYQTARAWPPPSLSGVADAATLPTYTATGTIRSLSPATFTAGVNAGSGWANAGDQGGMYVPIAGCSYPSSAWDDAVFATHTACSGAAKRAVGSPDVAIKSLCDSETSSTASAPEPTQSEAPRVVTGGAGSLVTTDTGNTFIYNNSFGGIWYHDPEDPFKLSAQAQSWRWGIDQVRGVGIGGWLVLEPFISPALYEPYMNDTNPAVDEWTLCESIAADPNSGGLAKVLEDHYSTFIVEEDFAQIAAAGLNWVRIAIPYWAIEVAPGEPFLEGVAWKYFLKAIEWARKYGIRINLDLHTAPGSHNGYNHSGKLGPLGWMNGTMGIANAQRTLNHIRVITQFISQPQYKDVVPVFGVINEARMAIIQREPLERL
ncbi:unnamed protein product [Rhizoctonia solani]|uniref:glucan 1,3-beta-glucosidase n=1 Tax=Rhizoctonia solani TaxID=456999 RepID=A0A8H3E265_9AGAM|nr:unnamed protein product [Rhizoctonia solani]